MKFEILDDWTKLYKIFWFAINMIPWLAVSCLVMYTLSGYEMMYSLFVLYTLFATAWHAGRIAMQIEYSDELIEQEMEKSKNENLENDL